MDDYDKQEHFLNIVKSINRFCHDKCFEKNIFDQECTKICYEKYVSTISKYNILLQKRGQEVYSEFIIKAYELDKNEKLDIMFPKGGYSPLHLYIHFKYNNKPIFPYEGRNDFTSTKLQN